MYWLELGVGEQVMGDRKQLRAVHAGEGVLGSWAPSLHGGPRTSTSFVTLGESLQLPKPQSPTLERALRLES